MPWGFAIAAGGAIVGATIQGNAAQNAAQTQANASMNATNTELSMFDTTQANLAPYMKSGKNALGALDYGLGIGPKTGAGGPVPYGSLTTPFSATQYQQSPGYAWQMSQGIDAVQNSASASGGVVSGNTMKALTSYGQGLANTDYYQALQAYMAQQQQTYGMLSNTAGSGQNAAAGLGAISANVGSTVGGNQIGAGNALAAGQIGAANAATGGINSLSQLGFLSGNGGMPGMPGGYPGYGTNPQNLGGSTPVAASGTLQYDQWGNIIGGGSPPGLPGP